MIPTYKTIRGTGKPRLMLVKALPIYTSTGTTTFSSTSISETEGSSITITSSSAATDQILTASAHGFVTNDWIRISGHTGSTPDINGIWKVEYIDSTHFKIGIDITVGGTGGTVRKTPAFQNIATANQRVMARYSSGDTIYECHAKIITIPDYQTITIDEWKPGTPSSGQTFYIDGWIADLPRTNELTEIFTPETLVHDLIFRNKAVKHYGFTYQCVLDYSKYVSGDSLLLLNEHFKIDENDRLILIPRIDKYSIQYNVGMEDPFQLSILGTWGYKGFSLKFFGTELVHGLDVESGYGYGYGLNYGYQL